MRLRRVQPAQLPVVRRSGPVDAATLAQAAEIVNDVRARGETALREHAERLGDVQPGEPLLRTQAELEAALAALPAARRQLLERTAERIRRFAVAQCRCLGHVETAVAGGRAGHSVSPVDRAGCYAPGGRFPLPSSVLMTAVTARAAGVGGVWVASPRPAPATLAAAAVAGADGFLAVGGAQAIAALAFGAGELPACDTVVGPGNRWVTAAKQWVAGHVGIDMLAGPSELVVLADESGDAALIAADLLAQAEHDPDARVALVTDSVALADAVDEELAQQLATLPTAETARAALQHGLCVMVGDVSEGIRVCDELAPEHLEVQAAHAERVALSLRHYGAVFLGAGTAEVFGDYGAGPNHVLPTGRTARFAGGLSVLTFLRVRTWMQASAHVDAEFIDDVVAFARLEGLEAHARAALARKRHKPVSG